MTPKSLALLLLYDIKNFVKIRKGAYKHKKKNNANPNNTDHNHDDADHNNADTKMRWRCMKCGKYQQSQFLLDCHACLDQIVVVTSS